MSRGMKEMGSLPEYYLTNSLQVEKFSVSWAEIDLNCVVEIHGSYLVLCSSLSADAELFFFLFCFLLHSQYFLSEWMYE